MPVSEPNLFIPVHACEWARKHGWQSTGNNKERVEYPFILTYKYDPTSTPPPSSHALKASPKFLFTPLGLCGPSHCFPFVTALFRFERSRTL